MLPTVYPPFSPVVVKISGVNVPWVTFIYRGGHTVGNILWGICRGEHYYIPWVTSILGGTYTVGDIKQCHPRYMWMWPTVYAYVSHGTSPTVYTVIYRGGIYRGYAVYILWETCRYTMGNMQKHRGMYTQVPWVPIPWVHTPWVPIPWVTLQVLWVYIPWDACTSTVGCIYKYRVIHVQVPWMLHYFITVTDICIQYRY